MQMKHGLFNRSVTRIRYGTVIWFRSLQEIICLFLMLPVKNADRNTKVPSVTVCSVEVGSDGFSSLGPKNVPDVKINL